MSSVKMQKVPLVLLPGLLNTARVWQAQRETFMDERMVICPKIHHHETISELVQEILSEVQAEKFALAGFSMGGYVALEILAQAKERLAGLALINSTAEPDTVVEQNHRRLSVKAAVMVGRNTTRFMGVTPRLIRKLLHPNHIENSRITEPLYEMAKSIGREGFIRQQNINIHRRDHRAVLKNFQCPVLLLSSPHDQIVRSEKTFAARHQVPHAQISMITNAGHLTPMESPDATSQAIREWLVMLD